MKKVKVGEISLGNKSSLVLISGLNVLEDESIVKEVVGELKKVCDELDIPLFSKLLMIKLTALQLIPFVAQGL